MSRAPCARSVLFDDIASRSNPIVHLCASPWIMSRDMKKVLLVYHRIYDSWGWCGGHCDGGRGPLLHRSA